MDRHRHLGVHSCCNNIQEAVRRAMLVLGVAVLTVVIMAASLHAGDSDCFSPAQVDLTVDSYADVTTGLNGTWAWQFIVSATTNHLVYPCDSNLQGSQDRWYYCPNREVLRREMAVFLERGMNQTSPPFEPPPPTSEMFLDVLANSPMGCWVNRLATDGITVGCGNGNFCVNRPVSRAQMATFLLKASDGASYVPNQPYEGRFTDVPESMQEWPFIEELARRGITAGCAADRYCPENTVTRAQMAVFLVRTWSLPY